MVVTRSSFDQALECLQEKSTLSLDTETTGLRPFHGDRLFSIIIGYDTDKAFYFNFQAYPDLTAEYVLLPNHLETLKEKLFKNPVIQWYIHNALFDMHMLGQEGIELEGTVHCTKALGRVVYNEHMKYGLDASLQRIGLAKDASVEKYIDDHKLFEKVRVGGKQVEKKNLQYNRVPFDLITKYGLSDATGGFSLGAFQEQEIERICAETPSGVPSLRSVVSNERRLTKTIYRLERVGIKIDRAYCVRAARYESDRAHKATEEFRRETGRDFKASAKLFATVFESERDKWEFTDKGNPSFESDVLKKFDNPAAKTVLAYRDAKSKADFYNGFLYHADRDDVVHPHFNSDGARHGRFSSSDPNFQNLTNEEDVDITEEFLIRRAIIPRPGFVFFMPDYDAMEYKLLLELICRFVGRLTPLAQKVVSGEDVHAATAAMAKAYGEDIDRKQAKMSNFLTIYGGGDKKLAEGLKCSLAKARAIRAAIREAVPEMDEFTRAVIRTAETRGFIFNWLGRRCYVPNKNFAYKGPNSLIAGGCADVMKVAMNNIDERLLTAKSRIVMTVHDELPLEVHESEIQTVPRMTQEFMETAFPSQYVRLTTSPEWSDKSLADKKKGFPV
jgi:DNA polymerase-1